jgi:hypothetical protein
VDKAGQRVINRLETIEIKEKWWNTVFMWSYIAGTLFLAINYMMKEMVSRTAKK